VIFLTVLVCGCLTHWHWKASLISHLSVILPFNPFHALEELLSSPYQITLLGNSAFENDFEGPGLLHELWLSKFLDENKSLTKSTRESSSITLTSHFTQYVDYNTARSLKEYKACKLKAMNFHGRKFQNGYAFRKTLHIFHYFMQSSRK
jgi:hypothetical protein